MKTIMMFLILGLASSAVAAEHRWYEFKGLYVGMPAAEAKELGLSECVKSKDIFDEICVRDGAKGDDNFKSIGGAPIDQMSMSIYEGVVANIYIKTLSSWNELLAAMTENYGSPKNPTTFYPRWDRGDTEISITMTGGASNEITVFFDSPYYHKAKRGRAEKAAKDF